MSHIFVGIYKESYGWIAPDMDVSGIEDEFCIASERGIDRLVYALIPSNAGSREERLKALIARAQRAGITIATYSDPIELRERIRNDVTAVVSGRFADQALVSFQAPTSEDLLDSLLPNPAHRFRRLVVERLIIRELQKVDQLIITGPLGAGKTILLAQLASDLNWIFIEGQGLSHFDLLVRTVNAIRARVGFLPLTLTTEDAANRELRRVWGAMSGHTLAIDSPSEPLAFLDLPLGQSRKLVLTSRSSLADILAARQVRLPSLTRDEIRTWVAALRGRPTDPAEVFKVEAQSRGSPLYLRFFALSTARPEDSSLRDLEIRAFAALEPRARELLSYLSIYGGPLTLGDAEGLLGLDDGPQAVFDCVVNAGSLLRQTKDHIELVHVHPRQTILDSLHENPTRLAFFAGRLGRYLEESKRYVAAFQVYSEGGDRINADRVVEAASDQAMLRGGGAPAVPILKRRLELAREVGQTEGRVGLVLALAYALKQTGARDAAREALIDAGKAAREADDELQLLRVREMAIILDLAGKPRTERINELVAIRDSYSGAGDGFDAARIATVLTTEYISAADYLNAEHAAREALMFFANVGDEYGCRLARVNLAQALGGQEGREKEAAAIALSLEQQFDPSEYPRERAVLCNFLTRHYRRLGDTALAANFAIEAIGIGEQLRDFQIIAMNRVNLGNVRRDEGDLALALGEYQAAEQCALESGVREHEAVANELIASVLSAQHRFSQATYHADYALAIAREIGDVMLMARAGEERGVALKGRGELDEAVTAYAEAAKAISNFPSAASYFATLLDETLSIFARSADLDVRVATLRSIFAPSFELEEPMSDPLAALYKLLPAIASCVDVDRLLPIIALTIDDLFVDMPPIIERKIILQMAELILGENPAVEQMRALAALTAILMTHTGKALTLGDVCDVAERAARRLTGIYFKPHGDGASHWNLRLAIGSGITVTVTQLDDDPSTAVTAMIVALLFASQQSLIKHQLLQAHGFPRNEVIIELISKSEFEQKISAQMLERADMSAGFVVMETSDVARPDQPPIIAILADDFGIPWQPSEHALSDAHLLFGRILRLVVAHLLGKVIEEDVLSPKIIAVVRGIGYRGCATHSHARFVSSDASGT